mgnify:CR=1 FL=1
MVLIDALQVTKRPLYEGYEGYYNIELTRDKRKILSIFYGGNLDLYFSLENFKNDPTFVIAKDRYDIFCLFDNLYKSIIVADIHGPLSEQEISEIVFRSENYEEDYHEALKEEIIYRKKYQKNLKESNVYQNLIQNGVIIWKSDDYPDEIAPFLKIKKEDSAYILSFGKPKIPKEYQNESDLILMDPRRITVRFRNSGSRYDPFNILFMNLYHGLCALDYEYHQIHIEEYLIGKSNQEESLKRTLDRKIDNK